MSLLKGVHKFIKKKGLIFKHFFLFDILAILVLIPFVLDNRLFLNHGADSDGLRVHFIQALNSGLLKSRTPPGGLLDWLCGAHCDLIV